jgi:ribokinase
MILVFGSINVDLVVPVERLPGPGETVLGGDYALTPGGKGANQALAARRAGGTVAMAGAVGRDAFAAIGLDLLRRAGVDLSLVRETERPTGCAAITVSRGGENQIAVASGANLTVTAAQVPDHLLGQNTILVCQMEVPAAETAALVRRARRRDARILLNLAPAMPLDPSALGDIDLLIANESEAATLGEWPETVARRLRQGLVVTLGSAGSVAYRTDGSRLAVPALPIEPVDTTGAGDTFVGVLAAGLDARLDINAALRRASAAAALACLGRGAQPAIPDAAAITAAAVGLGETREIR